MKPPLPTTPQPKQNTEMNTRFFTPEKILAQTKTERADPTLLTLFWAARFNQPSWLKDGEDNGQWCRQLLEWRKEIEEGRMIVFRENLREKSYTCDDSGRQYWGLNIQYLDHETNQSINDPLSLLLFGHMVAGHTYWFPNKKHRDNSWELLTRGREIPSIKSYEN